MSNVGIIRLKNHVLYGQVNTMQFGFDFYLKNNDRKTSDNHPSHLLMAKNPRGVDVEIGSAWQKELKDGTGHLLSLSFNDPSFGEEPLNLTAFQDTDNGGYDIVYSRPRKQTDTGFSPIGETGAEQPQSMVA